MLTVNIDSLAARVAQIAWIAFTVYTAILVFDTIRRNGVLQGTMRLLTFRILLPFAVSVGLQVLSMSIVFVAPQQVGVVVSAWSPNGIRPKALSPGLHFIIPLIEAEAKFPTYWQTYTMSGKFQEGAENGNDAIRARTSDGQEVELDTSVIFRIEEQQAVTIYTDWQQRYVEDFVRPVIRGYVRRQVSQFTVQEVNSSARSDLEALLDRLLREEFADKGLILDQFLLRDVSFSAQYASAVEEKQVALEGEVRTRYQAQQEVNLAEGRATAIRLEAEAQADALRQIAEALETNDQLLTYSYIQRLAPEIDVMLLPNDAPFLFPLPDIQSTQLVTTPLQSNLPITSPLPTTTPSPTPTREVAESE